MNFCHLSQLHSLLIFFGRGTGLWSPCSIILIAKGVAGICEENLQCAVAEPQQAAKHHMAAHSLSLAQTGESTGKVKV